MFDLKRQNKNKEKVKHGELWKDPLSFMSVYDNIIRVKYCYRPIINKENNIIYTKLIKL